MDLPLARKRPEFARRHTAEAFIADVEEDDPETGELLGLGRSSSAKRPNRVFFLVVAEAATAVDDEALARDEPRCLRDEEADRVGDVFAGPPRRPAGTEAR
jgi:hypothetical protein